MVEWMRSERLGWGRRVSFCTSNSSSESSLEQSRPVSSTPPTTMLKPEGKPAKNLALSVLRTNTTVLHLR